MTLREGIPKKRADAEKKRSGGHEKVQGESELGDRRWGGWVLSEVKRRKECV